MSKHGTIDLKITESEKSPNSGYVRLKAGENGAPQYIFSNGTVRHISTPWELPAVSYDVLDPTTLSPNLWDRYLIPQNAINDWDGHFEEIATWNGSAWEFTVPEKGWCTYLYSENVIYTFNGSTWEALSALPVVFHVTYDTLYDYYKNASFIPGAFYRIIDYESNNRTGYISDPNVYTSPSFELVVKAVENNELEYSAVEIGEPFHEIKYDVNMTIPAGFWTMKDTGGSTIDDEYFPSDGKTLIYDGYAPYFVITFHSDTEASFGSEVIVDYDLAHRTTFSFYDSSGTYITRDLSDPDLSWDDTTKTLTLSSSSGYTFFHNSRYYVSVNNMRVPSPERRKGKITYRTDLYRNIKGDIDWKYYKYKCYHSTCHEFDPSNPAVADGYYTCVTTDIRIQNPGIFSRTTVLDVDQSDYVLKSVFENVDFNYIDNVNFINCSNIVIENCHVHNTTFNKCRYTYLGIGASIDFLNLSSYGTTFYCSVIYGEYVKPTIISSVYSVFFGNISSSNINNTHSACIGNIDNCSSITIAGLRMNNQAIIRSTSGRFSTTHMLATAPNQTVFEKSTVVDMSRCYILDNTYVYGFKATGIFQSSTFENVNINNCTINFKNYANRINFEDINIEYSSYSGNFPVQNINFPELRSSDITGYLRSNITEPIVFNFIDVDDVYVVPEISVGIYIDSTASYNIELPANPFENQEVIFIDKTGLCHINNIDIVISSSPASGVINTINGDNHRLIDKRYGILTLRYNVTGGWLVVQETVVNNPLYPDDVTINAVSYALGIKNIDYIIDDDGESVDGSNTAMSDSHREIVTRAFVENYTASNNVAGDEITIDNETNYKTTSTSHNLDLELYDNWDNTAYTSDWSTSGSYDAVDSSIHLAPGADAILSYDGSSTTASFANGDYQLYSTIDLTSYSIYIYDDVAGSAIYPSSIVKENDLYLVTFSLSGGENIIEMGIDNNLDVPCTIWLINKNVPINTNNIVTIKNITNIIDSDDISIDNNIKFKDNPHNELITRDYVDKKISNADDITLEKEQSVSDVSTQSDVNLLLYESWSNEISNSGWSIGSHCSYSNGILSVNLPSSVPFEDILYTSNPTILTRGYNFRFISDVQLPDATISVLTSNELQSWIYNEQLLSNGYYEYSLYVPAQTEFHGLHFNQGFTAVNCNLQFYLMDQYPKPDVFKIKNIDYIIDNDNQSIDGSNTPMSDAHRELTTRAYTDDLFASNAHWNKVNNVLSPADPLVEAIEWERNFNGYTRCTMKNTDDSGNAAGAVIELKGSGSDYTNNMYIGKYGANFWITALAGNGAVMSDKSVCFGTVTNTEKINIICGGGYSAPSIIASWDTNGLNIESLKTSTPNPTNYLNVCVDTDTGLLYANSIGVTTPTKISDSFDVDATIISNNYIDLSQNIDTSMHEFVFLNGVLLEEGSSNDYTYSGNRITFTSNVNLTLSDRIVVKYYY